MNEDKIIQKLMEHDERFDLADEKLSKFREEFLSGQDALMTELKKFNLETTSLHHRVSRLEDKVEEHDKVLAG